MTTEMRQSRTRSQIAVTNQAATGALKKMLTEGSAALCEDGAEALVLGCMSMGFMDVSEKMSSELGVPVVNPVKTGLKMAESLAALGLHHSRKAYLLPKKMQMGKSLEDLFIR